MRACSVKRSNSSSAPDEPADQDPQAERDAERRAAGEEREDGRVARHRRRRRPDARREPRRRKRRARLLPEAGLVCLAPEAKEVPLAGTIRGGPIEILRLEGGLDLALHALDLVELVGIELGPTQR